ncbi:MAG: dehydrogenase [Thermomicrobiales bacterium]|nr:MAG: dehydrogenase [Thermomicrobiales bacterium]
MPGVRVGIIGCGNVTMYAFIPAMLSLEGVELVALADPTPERLKDAAEAGKVGPEACTSDWREVIGRADVDAVVIATPQRIRPEIARAAAEAGKHILAEKPLALTPAEAWSMVEAARRAGVVLATVHNYTFMPVYQMIKEIIQSGEIGRLETVVLNFLSVEDRPGAAAYRPRWRHDVREAGGGVLMDMLHAVYLGWWFFDERPVSVSGFVDRRLDQDGDVEDYALVRYTLPSGQAMVNMAWGKGPGGLEIAGSDGRIILVNKDHLTHPFVPPDTIHVFGRSGERQYEPERGPGYGHLQTVASFRDAILKGTPPAATGEQGAHVLEAVVGSYKSCATGCEVRLPLSPEDPVYQKGALGIADLGVAEHSPIRRRGLYGVAAAGNR